MAAVPHLGVVEGKCETTHKEQLMVLYVKFGCSWLHSFEDMGVLMLHKFGLKMRVYAPFGRVFCGKWKVINVIPLGMHYPRNDSL